MRYLLFILFVLFFNASFGALAIGNITSDKNTVTGTTKDFNHNHNTGDDGHLFIIVIMKNNTTVSDVTYNSVSATQVTQYVTTSNSIRHEIWELDAPATGINTLEVTFATAPNTAVQVTAYSFTGCQGYGNFSTLQTATAPISTNLTVSENSMIIAEASGSNQDEAITINSSGRTLNYSESLTGANCFGAESAAGLPAGSITCEATSSVNTSIMVIEVQEVVVAAARRIFITN